MIGIKFNCQVCNDNEVDTVRCSALGAISIGYCNRCFKENLEPLGLIVSHLSMIPYEETIAVVQEIIDNSLKFYGVKMEDLNITR